MKRNTEIYYQAVMARDYRFDGKFFVGVKTTGIYCRPICPAKPKKENIEFYPSALAAERNGYRPCLRCRPESAPLSSVWIGKSAVIQRALKRIAQDPFTEENETDFAAHFGLSSRHLRRLFQEELGLTPKQIHAHQRLNLALKLISETNLPFTEIAFASGYASIRRFNDAIQNSFQRSPSQLRRKTPKNPLEIANAEFSLNAVQLNLSYRPPLDWSSLLHYYQSHRIEGIESIDGETYSRSFHLNECIGKFRLSPSDEPHSLRLSIHTSDPTQLGKAIQKVTKRVRQMFDLDSDPLLIANSFSDSNILTQLIEKYPGLRLPQGWDPFEVCICTILGQLVSVEQARKLVHQLITLEGKKTSDGYLFPTPEALMSASLTELGTTGTRKNTIRELARLVHEKKISLESTQDPAEFRKALLQIKGLGPWTAEYISLRALGDTDAFPGTDLILKRAVELHADLDLKKFSPWRSYAAIYLWKEYATPLSKKTKAKE